MAYFSDNLLRLTTFEKVDVQSVNGDYRTSVIHHLKTAANPPKNFVISIVYWLIYICSE